MNQESPNIKGLTSIEVQRLQAQYGKNTLSSQKKESFLKKVLGIISEPMFLLLIAAATLYFILGNPTDGLILMVFVVGIITIEVIQEWKTDKTLNALKDLSAPRIEVIRDGIQSEISSEDLVPGDLMIITEGIKIPADGFVVCCNDLCVDESTLTGEPEGVWKVATDYSEAHESYWRNDYCYAGTMVTQGSGTVLIKAIATETEYGKIGVHIAEAPTEKTPLQKQMGKIVRISTIIAVVLFLSVAIFTWFNLYNYEWQKRFIESILAGITLAMAMIPEEFPVILAVFLSMGAWRLAKKQSIVRKLPSVETLGAVSVLCVDKTGTITMNQMSVADSWLANGSEEDLIETMGLACETDAYDPMEKAMLSYCEEHNVTREHLFGGRLISEYAFTNQLKMMGHIWYHDDEIIIAAKGSPERILTICEMTREQRNLAEEKLHELSNKGLRVIAIASTKPLREDLIPQNILDCQLTLCGFIGLMDPPRANVKEDITTCHNAGIRVVMITGDNGVTAASIARQIGMRHTEEIITGDMLSELSDEKLREKVKEVSIFSRVIPEHKMRIVRAFKENGHIVAMTGDGVNDAPALKYADIGIAMGLRGSEVAREAADLTLMDDNFHTIVETVKDGRRIFDNIRKAIGYVFAIHIPIALSSLIAPLLGIRGAALLFIPTIVVLLEVVIDPTCSVVLERPPAELDIMERGPRKPTEGLLNARVLLKSTIQGLTLFAASFGLYFYMLQLHPNEPEIARTMGLLVLIVANLCLVQVNCSDIESVFSSVHRDFKDKVMWGANAIIVMLFILLVYTPINQFLGLTHLHMNQVLITIGLGVCSVVWYEVVKLVKRIRRKYRNQTY